MAETFVVPIKGIGKPDYTREISLGQVRPGLSLKFNQSLIINALVLSAIASPFAWVFAPLAPGATAHMVDTATGLALPYTVPQGYTYAMIQSFGSINQDSMHRGYMSLPPAIPLAVLLWENHVSSGQAVTKYDIIGISTSLFDPTGANPHIVDVTQTNMGLGNLSGSFQDVIIFEAVGTPPFPKTKDIRCKWCGYIVKDVPRDLTSLICPKCSKVTIYFVPDIVKRSS